MRFFAFGDYLAAELPVVVIVAHRGNAGSLREAVEIVAVAHPVEHVDKRGVGYRPAYAHPGERPALRSGADHYEVGVFPHELSRAEVRERRVSLVDEDYAVKVFRDFFDGFPAESRARGGVGVGEEKDVRAARKDFFVRDFQTVFKRDVDELRAFDFREYGIERIARVYGDDFLVAVGKGAHGEV